MAKAKQEMSSSKKILLTLTFLSLAFIVAALFKGNVVESLKGCLTINLSPSQFTRDYFKLGTVGGAFLNTGLIGLTVCGLLALTKAKCNGLTVAAYWLNVGFATFGMTFITMWPFIIGGFIYSRIKKVSFGSVINFALFSTALAPFAGDLLFRYPQAEARGFSFWGLAGALLLGIVAGCVMPALCGQSANFHKGYDLYNAGPAAGFLAFVVLCLLYKSTGIAVPSNTDLGNGDKPFVNVFFLIVFTAMALAGCMMDKDCFKNYKKLWQSDGYKMDYTAEFGVPATLINMGVYGLFILLYFNAVHGFTMVDGALTFTGAKFTGATMGAIMCMHAFSAQGAQPRTVFPIMIGYFLASLVPFACVYFGVVETSAWTLTTQAMLVGMCFASGLAPVAGKFGFFAGIVAGAIHALLVMNVPALHGGFCLYNGGFTAGIAAFVLVPVLESFFGTKEERKARKAEKAAK